MKTIHMVGGLFGDSLDMIPCSGMRAIEESEAIIYPGDWIGPSLRAQFKDRLHYGRQLTLDDVLEVVDSALTSTVLYCGDFVLMSGRHDVFPSALVFAGMLRERGWEVAWHPGVSAVTRALIATGLEVFAHPDASLRVAAPLACRSGGEAELTELARGPDLLALLWFEDRVQDAWRALSQTVRVSSRAHLVQLDGAQGDVVHSGLVCELRERFQQLEPPWMLIVEPAAESEASQAQLPDDVLGVARQCLDANPAQLTWLVGVPGSGKTTLLEAIRQVDPDIVCIELGKVVRLVAGDGPHRPGGLMRAARVAEWLRSEVRSRPAQRTVIATAGLPVTALELSQGERVLVLDPGDERACMQREQRPPRQAYTASSKEVLAHARLVAEIAALPHVRMIRAPFVPALLGRAPDVATGLSHYNKGGCR